MPRKLPPTIAVAPIDALVAPPPPSPLIQKLRTDWRWAAISQFVWMFSDAFGFVDWDIEELEADLDGDETRLLPELLAKLLYTLTYNRQINRDNAMEHLRKQYAKRTAEENVLGTVDDPVEWATLGLSQKVQILWRLCEWQMEDPARFRALLKEPDDEVSWRIDPIGWDKAGNTYFLFDDNRLWIQRLPPPPPRPPKKSSLKAKRALKRSRQSTLPAPKKSHKRRDRTPDPTPPQRPKEEEEPVSGPRKRTQVSFYGNPTPTVQALKRGALAQTATSSRATRSSERSQLSVSKSQGTPSKVVSSPSKTPLPLGTRVSRRLRNVEDEWQQVPDDWLQSQESGTRTGGKKGKVRATEADAESELSDLTDEEEHEARVKAATVKSEDVAADGTALEDAVPAGLTGDFAELETAKLDGVSAEHPHDDQIKLEEAEAAEGEPAVAMIKTEDEPDAEDDMDMDEIKLVVKEAANLPDDFVEWEAICVTLYDWRTFPLQFEKSRDPDERALFDMLHDGVGPKVIDALVVKEQERIKQEAVMNRKRSSRIAMKELEKEERERREKAEREMEERMEKQRKEEERVHREELQALAREKAREDRLKEREERAQAREMAVMQKALEQEQARERSERDREMRKRRREGGSSGAGDGSDGEATAAATKVNGGEQWELNCEICGKIGWNIDGDQDVVSCDDCSRWQHVDCHNRSDLAEGRPMRDWDKVDFKCQECRRRAARKRQRLEEESKRLLQGGSATPPPGVTHQNHFVPPAQHVPSRDPAQNQSASAYVPYANPPPQSQHYPIGPLPNSHHQPYPPAHPVQQPPPPFFNQHPMPEQYRPPVHPSAHHNVQPYHTLPPRPLYPPHYAQHPHYMQHPPGYPPHGAPPVALPTMQSPARPWPPPGQATLPPINYSSGRPAGQPFMGHTNGHAPLGHSAPGQMPHTYDRGVRSHQDGSAQRVLPTGEQGMGVQQQRVQVHPQQTVSTGKAA